MTYTPYYPGGWTNTSATTVTADALNNMEAGIEATSSVLSPAWVFTPESYGAVGNGRVIADATIASGSLSTLTSASAGFTSADTGKHIMINGAQGAATPLCTTITYVNATTVTLASPATQALTAGNAIYGTDDTAAFVSMLAAMKTYAEANEFYAKASLSPKYYCIAGAPRQTTSPAVQNAQLPLPYPTDLTGKGRKIVIEIAGTGNGSNSQYWESTIPNLQGTCLVSMVVAPATADTTYGIQSVLGGPSGGGAFTGGFANMKAVVSGVTIWTGATTNQYAFDFRWIGGANVSQCSAQAFSSVAGSQPNLPSLPGNTFFQSRISAGLYMPVAGNNADSYVDNFAVEGFVIGIGVADTFTAGHIEATYCAFGLMIDLTIGLSNNLSRISIQNFCCGESLAAIHTNGTGKVPVSINMSTELIETAHIQDSGDVLYGSVHWNDTGTLSPVITGGANLTFVNESVAPAPELSLVASTGASGYTLNSTAGDTTIFSWTAPNDGNLHRFMLSAAYDVTGTAGNINNGTCNMFYNTPGGASAIFDAVVDTGASAPSSHSVDTTGFNIIGPGKTVTLQQSAAMTTAGITVTLWAELWAS